MSDLLDLFTAPWDGFRRLDVMDALRLLPADSIDLVITDPAYESLERHRAKGTTTRLKVSDASSNAWFETISNDRMRPVFAEFYRILRPRTHCYILCDDPTDEVYRTLARDAGFWVWKALIWVKTTRDGRPRGGMGYHWRNATERILMLEKRSTRQVHQAGWTVRTDPTGTGRKLRELGWTDVLQHEPVKGYPTEKPVDLIERLIENSSAPGERVFDPFAGSGSTLVAARRLGRSCTTSDVSEASEAHVSIRMSIGRGTP